MSKATHQPVAGVHSQDDESSFGFSSLVQLGENAVKTEATFGVSAAALNGILFTRILVYLAINFCVCQGGFSAAQSPAVREFIEAAYGDIQEYLTTRIEAEVRKQKNEASAL